jgi:hypothetical protein
MDQQLPVRTGRDVFYGLCGSFGREIFKTLLKLPEAADGPTVCQAVQWTIKRMADRQELEVGSGWYPKDVDHTRHVFALLEKTVPFLTGEAPQPAMDDPTPAGVKKTFVQDEPDAANVREGAFVKCAMCPVRFVPTAAQKVRLADGKLVVCGTGCRGHLAAQRYAKKRKDNKRYGPDQNPTGPVTEPAPAGVGHGHPRFGIGGHEDP